MKLIYFDNNLIDANYYGGLERTAEIFNKSFKLGATICETYKFKIDKSQIVDKEPSVVYLYSDNKLEKTLFIDSYEEDDFTITYDLVDSMVDFNFGYDASSIFVDGSTTLGAIFQDICLKANISTDITTFDYSTMEISWYDNTITARSYLGMIAELNGSYCYITSDNKLAMKKANRGAVINYNFDELGKYKIGQKHKFSRVVYETENIHWEYGTDTDDTYYVDSTNVFITDESMIEHIYDYINGYEFYNVEIENFPGYNGKNLFKMPLENGSSKGITWVINEDGSITLNGTSTGHININSQSINMPVVVGETYTISTTNLPVGNIGFKEENGTDIWVLTANSSTKTQTITSDMKIQDIRFAIYIPPNRVLDNVTITFQLEKSSTATDYEPYSLQVGDNITIIDENDVSYNTILRYDKWNLAGDIWFGGLKIEVENEKQQETEIIDVDKRIRGIKQTLDRDGNQIQTLIEDTTVLNRKVSDNTTNINNNYQEIIEKFNDVASVDDVSLLRQAMQTTMNEQELKIENIQSAVVNGVEKVINTSGTFDDNGLTMEKTGAKTKSVLNETGLDIQDSQGYSNEDLFFSGYVDSNKAQSNQDLTNYEGQTIVYTKNIIVKNYFSVGTHSRIEDYEDGTGAFPLGG